MDHITLQVYDAPQLKVTVYQPREENETKEKYEAVIEGMVVVYILMILIIKSLCTPDKYIGFFLSLVG